MTFRASWPRCISIDSLFPCLMQGYFFLFFSAGFTPADSIIFYYCIIFFLCFTVLFLLQYIGFFATPEKKQKKLQKSLDYRRR